MKPPEIEELLRRFSELQGIKKITPELRLQASKILKDIQEFRRASKSQPPASSSEDLFGLLDSGAEAGREILPGREVDVYEYYQSGDKIKKRVSGKAQLVPNPVEVFPVTLDLGKYSDLSPFGQLRIMGERMRPGATQNKVYDLSLKQRESDSTVRWTSDFRSFQSGQPSEAEIADSIYNRKTGEFVGYKGDWVWDDFEFKWVKRPKSKKDVVPEFFLSSNRFWEAPTKTEQLSASLIHSGLSDDPYRDVPRNVIEDISGQVKYVQGTSGQDVVPRLIKEKGVFTQEWFRKSIEIEEAEERLTREVFTYPEKRAAWEASLTPYGREWLISRGGIDTIVERVRSRMAIRMFGSGGAASVETGRLSNRPSRYWDEEIGRYVEQYSLESSYARWQKEQMWGEGFPELMPSEKEPSKILPGEDIGFIERLGGKDKLKELYEANPSTFFYPYQPIGTLVGPESIFDLNRYLTSGGPRSILGSRSGSFIGTVGEDISFKKGGARTAAQKVWVYDETGKIRVTTFTENEPTPLVKGQTYRFQQMKIQPYVPPGSSDVQWNANAYAFSEIMPFSPPEPVPRAPPRAAIDYSKPVVVDTVKGEMRWTSITGEVVTSPMTKWRIGTQRGDMAAFLPFAGVPFFLQGSMTADAGSQPAARQNAGEQVIEMLGSAYSDISTLGGIWYRKASEAYERIKARDAAAPGAEFGNPGLAWANAKYQMAQLPWNVLDVLGGALYPLSYPGQALWGELSGIGAMEGIRSETHPAGVLGIENPIASLAVDIAGDPLTWMGTGVLTKGKQALGSVKALLEDLPIGLQVKFDESAVLGGAAEKTLWEKARMSRTEYVRKVLAEAKETGAEQPIGTWDRDEFNAWKAYNEANEAQKGIAKSFWFGKLELAETGNVEWSADELMAEYDMGRLDELSGKPYTSLTLAERSELNDLIFKDMFKDSGVPVEPAPLTEEDYLRIQRDSEAIQRSMKARIYQERPIATIDGVPIPPLTKAEQEEALRQLAAQKPPVAEVLTPRRLQPPVEGTGSQAADETTEALVQETIARRESRGEVTTPQDVEKIRSTVQNNAEGSERYWARKEEEKKVPWGTAALGIGIGAATTASLASLPQDEKEAGREEVREALKPSEKPGVLETAMDILSTDSYLEGAALMDLRGWLTGDTRRYGWGDRITPSVALNFQDKDTEFFSLRGLAGTALDIAITPSTYLSLGTGAAVKIGSVGGKGAKALKLSRKGVRELRTFTEKYGEEMGTLEFAHRIEQSPEFKKKVLAAGGVNLRGWGQEINLIPGSAFEPIAEAARTGKMQFALEHPEEYRWLSGKWERLEDRFVVKAAIKRLPRSPRLAPMEADYVEKSLLLPKKVKFDIALETKMDIELAKRARKAFGENYEEIVSDLIEVPVTRESANLTEEQRAIVEELEAVNKVFAVQEKELGLLDTEMSGYLRHTLTPEAREYLEKGGKKVSTEMYTPLSVENRFATKRAIQGTVAEINERARKELGIDFDYFEANPFKATSIRRAESVKAVEQAKLLKWTVEKYGVSEEIARAHPDEYVQSSVSYIKGAWLPRPIAEDIEKEFVQKDTGELLRYYDRALGIWKYGATVTHPAYHATNVIGGIFNNWLGEINPLSYYRGSRVLLGGDKEKAFRTALGGELTGGQLLKEAGEAGILAQPGMMDIEKLSYEIADTQKEKSIEFAKKLANAPITTAQYEENFLRFSMYLDRRMKGDTVQGARAWVSEFQFQYSKESFTPFERDYMKRAVPFYAWMRGNVPLMGKQLVLSPGKFVQFGKLTNAAVGGQDLPQYTEGDFTWMWPRDESTGTFNYMRTPATDLDIFDDPLWYGMGAITPFAKYPAEQVLGFNTYTLMDFDPDLPWYDPQHSATSNLAAGRTGRDIRTLSDVYEDRNAGKQVVKYLTGAGQAATKTRKKSYPELRDAYRKYTGRPNDFSYEQRLALMQRDNWASAQSGISGEFEQLQGGHFYPADLGGAPLPWNYITQTREENLEWLSAQLYIENLPEREIQQEEAWGRYEAEYSAGVEEINARTLDNRGRPENEAQKEKRRYDLRKAANIKMYNRQLNTVRAAIRSAEKDLRGEKKKVEDAKAKGYSDPASEAQIKVIEAVLVEYRALYEKVSGLRDAEQGKEFELPVQGTELSRFQPMDIGGYDKYAVRYGRGPELAKPENIEKLVDLKKITAFYAAMKSYGPVVGFRPRTPEAVKNRILFTRDARYEELAQIANPLVTGAGWEGISGKNYIGPRNISELRKVVEGTESELEPVMGMGEPPAWYSRQQIIQEPKQAAEFDYNDPEFREAIREIVQETLSEGIVSD